MMREFFVAAAEITFAPGSVLVGGDVKLSGTLGDSREVRGLFADWDRLGSMLPLPNVQLGVRLSPGVPPTKKEGRSVEEPWSPNTRPPSPLPPPPPPPPLCTPQYGIS